MGLREDAHLLNRLIGYGARLTETEKQAFVDMRKRVQRLQSLSEKQRAWAEGVLLRVTRPRR